MAKFKVGDKIIFTKDARDATWNSLILKGSKGTITGIGGIAFRFYHIRAEGSNVVVEGSMCFRKL